MTLQALADDLNKKLKQDIPITRHMGVQITDYDGQSLTLAAPLTPNLNDKATGFAGSLYSLCTLTGWCLLSLKLKQAGLEADVAIYESDINFSKPVCDNIQSTCVSPKTETIENFFEAFRAKGKAKIELNVTIRQNSETLVAFTGRYVALCRN